MWTIHSELKWPLAEADKIKIERRKSHPEITIQQPLRWLHHRLHCMAISSQWSMIKGNIPAKNTVQCPTDAKNDNWVEELNYGTGFLSCQCIIHMMGGMARVISYDTPRDSKIKRFHKQDAHEGNSLFNWGNCRNRLAMTSVNLECHQILESINLNMEYGL